MLLLVISPRQSIRDYLGNVCRHFGYVVEFANDSQDALERLENLPQYSMVLLDGLDQQFAEIELAILRTEAPQSDVVILTAEEDGANWKRQGARGVLLAPILPSRLKVELIRLASQAA